MIELKKSYREFSKGTTEHELAIATMDKKLYNFNLTTYIKAA